MPIVLFDRITEALDTHKVIVDNYKASYEATCHLLNNGYKKIACILNAPHLSIAIERTAGYRQALLDNNIEPDEDLIKVCRLRGALQKEVEKAVDELLKLKLRPDCNTGLSDKLTTGCLRVLQAKKIRVPEEIGLIGFSNSDLAGLLNPSLSVIRQTALEMGEIATRLLIEMIEAKCPVTDFKRMVLQTQLITRSSSVSILKQKTQV